MKSLFIILIGLSISWYYTDLSSESFLNSVLAPLFVFIFMVSIPLWLVIKAGFSGNVRGSGHYAESISPGLGDFGGGD